MLLVGATLMPPAWAATTNLYSTQFEAAEGFSASADLAGQQGWDQEGSGGNGVLTSGLQGQSAYIGFTPPDPVDDNLILYRPINFTPLAAGYPLCYFADKYRWVPLDRTIYALSFVPFHPRAVDGLWIAGAAILVSFLATLYPSRNATRIAPAEVLRYE